MAFVVDGTFLCFDNTYDVKHFEKIYQMLQDKDIRAGYAMKNESEIVKRVAKYQAPGNQESGVLEVLEREIAK